MQLLAYPRDTTSLGGTWQAIPDQYEQFYDRVPDMMDEDAMPTGFEIQPIYEPEASADSSLDDFNIYDGLSVEIPSSFGEEIPEFRHYEGWVWFARTFENPIDSDDRAFLRFGAVNYKADAWLNGEHLGSHEGGYTPFSFEVTDALEEGENVLVVRMDNSRYEDGIPNEWTDWYNFGGINRSVEVVTVPERYVRNFRVETSLENGDVTVGITAWVDGQTENDTVTASFPELGEDVELTPTEANGEFIGELTLSETEVTLWSPDTPQLYTVQVEVGEDSVADEVGFREVEVDGNDILLNGEPIWLRGIALHEESAGKGRALDSNDVEERFEWLADLGCNYARLAHYPHTEAMARKADEEGILLWEEVPAYHDINFGDEEVQALYRQQLRELIERDWNRPSVILWSIANETYHTDDTRNAVLPRMADYVRELDETRLVTAACFTDDTDDGIVLQDPLEEHLDVIGINEYYGWYYGDADDMEQFQEEADGTPVVISETGGGAKWGNHGDEDERWTEEFQAAIYEGQTAAAADNDQIAGMSPWILFDFRAPMRQNEHQRGYNRKGLLDPHGRKKQAFHVLKDFYRSNVER